MKVHELKCWSGSFDAIVSGAKTFEYRSDDRDYSIGDTLHLCRWDPTTKQYTGEAFDALVTWILHGGAFGVPFGYCVMSIAPVRPTAPAQTRVEVLATATIGREYFVAPGSGRKEEGCLFIWRSNEELGKRIGEQVAVVPAAQLDALNNGGWRDIATAPKDGSEILGYDDEFGRSFACSPSQPIFWAESLYDVKEWVISDEAHHSFNPTLWMPLPPTPSGESK